MDRLGSLLRDHGGILASGAVGLVVALRLAAVSGYNPQTAYVLLQTQGTSSAAFGTLVQALALLPLLMFFALLNGLVLASPSDGTARLMLIGVGISTVAIVLIWPLAIAIFMVLFQGLPFLYLFHQNRKFEAEFGREGVESAPTRPIAWGLGAVIAPFVVVPLFDPNPWLPREDLTFANLKVSGFMLSEPDERDTVLVLQAKPRVVMRLDGSKLTRRHLCEPPARTGVGLGNWRFGEDWAITSKSLAAILTSSGDYPECEY
jgi:hypothetical protein